MAVKNTLEKNIPEVEESIQYLKSCEDFESEEAVKHYDQLQRITSESECEEFGSLFPKMWKALSPNIDEDKWRKDFDPGLKALLKMLETFSRITKSRPELGVSLGKYGGISLLFAGLNQIRDKLGAELVYQPHYSFALKILTILQNSIRLCPSNLMHYRNTDAVTILKRFFQIDGLLQFLSMLVQAYVATESEKESFASATSKESVRVLTDLLKDAVKSDNHSATIGAKALKYDFSAFETLSAIKQLAINDDIKTVIAEENAIPSIIKMLQDDFSPNEQRVAADALGYLAFSKDIRQSDELQSTVPTLKNLRENGGNDLRDVCASALYTIQGYVNTTPSTPPSYQEAISEPNKSTRKKSVQIMLSYQWDSQKRVIQIRDRLTAAGFTVWMDLTHMRGDILDAMAKAVQDSDIILMCMTEKYKDSRNCRLEAEYAYREMKSTIPLLFENGYKPDGWLGILQGMKLYYRFYSDDDIEESLEELLKAIDDSISTPSQQETKPSRTVKSKKPAAAEWRKEDVQKWFKENGWEDL